MFEKYAYAQMELDMRKSQNLFDLESLAASQWGMFTTAQARRLGVRPNQVARMVGANQAEAICYGVYRFCMDAEPALVEVKAAWLSVYPALTVHERMTKRPHDAVLAGRTAAYALGAGDFLGSPYTFAVARRKQTSREDMCCLKGDVDEADVVFASGLPATSYERTVYDLYRLHEDPDLIGKFMQDACRTQGHQFDAERLSALLAPLASKYGYGKNDGEAFAHDLLSRNAAPEQMERASREFVGALNMARNSRQGSRFLEQVDQVARAILDSGLLDPHGSASSELDAVVVRYGAC